jgi:flagellar hook-associated protein 1 FlgK
MTGLNSAMNTALTGLNAFETGIGIVSQNLTNQTTPGYGIESTDLTTATGTPGQPGNGVQTPVVSRVADGFSAGLLRTAQSSSSAASALSTSLTGISNALQNNGDIQTALNQFFLDIGSLASDPSSQGAQQTVLSEAQTVTSSFQSASSALASTQTGAITSLNQGVTQANSLLTQLAAINKSLQADQQEAALNTLSNLLPVNVLPLTGGQVLLTTGGTVLLDQSGAQSLTLTTSTTTAPVITTGNPPTPLNLTQSAGSLGGNIQAWQSAAQATQSLNSLATIFASSINTAQAQGLTTTGAQGGNLFSIPAPTALAASTNTGTAALTPVVTNASQLATNGGPYTVSYTTANGWTAVNQASGQTYTGLGTSASTNIAFAGLTIGIANTPSNGDSYTVNPSPGAAAALSVSATQPDAIASADPYVATPGTLQTSGGIVNSNGGTTTIGTDTVTSTPATGAVVVPSTYYGQPLQITFTSATTYTVSTAATATPPSTLIATTPATGTLVNGTTNIAVAYPTTGAASGDYWQLPITASPTTGDTITLSPGGSGSGSNATRLAGLWTATAGTTSGSLQQAVVSLSTGLGANAQAGTQLVSATASQVSTATTNLQNIAGVSSDQQAVLLTNYSQAYQAAAQVISSAHTAFETLLSDI